MCHNFLISSALKPRGFCSRVGGVRRCGGWWGVGCCRCRVMGHYSRAIDFITVTFTFPPPQTPLSACNSFNSLMIRSDSIRAERSRLFFSLFCFFLNLLEHEDAALPTMKGRTRCNHAPPVGFIKFSYFTHSQACCKRAHSCTFPPNTQFFPHSRLWWNRSCHAVTVCGRRTNKCSSPGSCDLNGKATWQFDSERPHNQTPHPQLSTSTSGQEAVFALPVQHPVPDSFHPPKIPFICRAFLFPLLK